MHRGFRSTGTELKKLIDYKGAPTVTDRIIFHTVHDKYFGVKCLIFTLWNKTGIIMFGII